jgi:membrane dipeptidase
MMALAFVVDPAVPTLSRWIDHVDHAVAVMGIEHVGIGADFVDQVVSNASTVDAAATAELKAGIGLEGFTGPDHYPALVGVLGERGYEGERLEAITNANWLRVLRETMPGKCVRART